MYVTGAEYPVAVIQTILAIAAFLEDTLVNFFTMHLHVGRCLDADSDLIPFNAQYGDRDVVPNDKFLSNSSCQYEHSYLPLVSDTSRIRASSYLLRLCQNHRETI